MARADRAPARSRLRSLRADRRLSRQDLRAVRRDDRRPGAAARGISRGRFTACSAITTRSAWSRRSRRWASACCSTRPRRSCAATSASISSASTTPITIGSTTSKRRPRHVPDDAFSILLSHTPEIYRQAAHADFDLLLSGHTHGGQICLPGGIPITLDAVLPRRMGSGYLALSRHGRLHLGRHRLVHRSGPAQLPARDHAASPAQRRSASIGAVAQIKARKAAATATPRRQKISPPRRRFQASSATADCGRREAGTAIPGSGRGRAPGCSAAGQGVA